MRFKLFVPPLLAVGLLSAALPAFSQVVPTYKARAIPIEVGAGPSSFNVDWGHGRMLGITAWADYYPAWFRHFAPGLGIDVEGRDINYDRNATEAHIRQDTISGGGIYNWHLIPRFHPYAKFLVGYGSYDFVTLTPYTHDTRALMAGGGGFEARFAGPLWVRADYEYQVWQKLMGNYPDPQGFTLGVSYDLSHPQGR